MTDYVPAKNVGDNKPKTPPFRWPKRALKYLRLFGLVGTLVSATYNLWFVLPKLITEVRAGGIPHVEDSFMDSLLTTIELGAAKLPLAVPVALMVFARLVEWLLILLWQLLVVLLELGKGMLIIELIAVIGIALHPVYLDIRTKVTQDVSEAISAFNEAGPVGRFVYLIGGCMLALPLLAILFVGVFATAGTLGILIVWLEPRLDKAPAEIGFVGWLFSGIVREAYKLVVSEVSPPNPTEI